MKFQSGDNTEQDQPCLAAHILDRKEYVKF